MKRIIVFYTVPNPPGELVTSIRGAIEVVRSKYELKSVVEDIVMSLENEVRSRTGWVNAEVTGTMEIEEPY